MHSIARRLVSVCFVFLFATPFTWSQQHSFERFADELGGRQSSVYNIFRDARGFLWFAGDTDGLLRYDGYELIRWAGDDDAELGRVSYSAVMMSQRDELWAATWGSGLFFWQHEENRFAVFNTDNSALPDNRVQTLFEDSRGRIWVGTLNGLAVLENQQLQPIESRNPLHKERIWGTAELNEELWFATTTGLYRANSNNTEWQQYLPFPERFGNNRINEIRTVRVVNDRIWVGVDGGLFEFDPQAETFIPVKFPGDESKTHPQVNTLYSKGDNKLWMGAENGLYLVDTRRHRFVPAANGRFISAPDVDVRHIATDTNGAIWLGARDQGILHSSPLGNDFQVIAEQAPEPLHSLLQRTISAIHVAPNDDVWMGIPNGVARWRMSDHTWQHWFFPVGNALRRAESIETDHSGRTWVASNSSLYFIEEGASAMTEATAVLQALEIQSTAVTKIFQDSAQRLWLGFWGRGLANYDPNANEEEPEVSWDFTALGDLRGDLVYDLVEQEGTGLWLVTRFSGLWHKPDDSAEWIPFEQIAEQQGWQGSLPEDGMQCLFLHTKNELWVCSESGLLKLNFDTQQIDHYTRANGLPSDRVQGVTRAPGINGEVSGRLWITTSRGISLYEREHEQFLNFGLFDGLPALEFLRAALDVTSDGRVYAGTVKGALEFSPASLDVSRDVPNVGLSRVWVDDEDITGRLHFTQPALHLARDHRSVAVQYSVLDFKGASSNAGRYRLLGLNDEWSVWSELRQITFTTLPPGEYVLEIEGRNSLGIVADAPLRIDIVVERPWWASPWVWVVGVAILLVLLVLIVQLRFAALARINRRLDNQVKERTLELEALALELRAQSQTDYLTKLPNRRGFIAMFERVAAQAKRHDQPLTLVLFDVDHFKRFNDEHGHEAGDQVLIALSKLFREHLREQDVIGRWGGEEFAMLLPDTPLAGGVKLCESLRERLEAMVLDYNGERLRVTATFGIHTGNSASSSLEKWMQFADDALYRGKELGRNRVAAYAPE